MRHFLWLQTQEKNKEIRLNEEAVRMIQFDFSGIEKPQEELKTHPMNQPWMEFKKDLRIPRSLIDTTKVKKPTGYIRAEPYTIWTRFGEDPVYDVLVLGRPKNGPSTGSSTQVPFRRKNTGKVLRQGRA